MSEVATPRRKSLLEHFSAIKDNRQSCKVMYPLSEVLLLVVCGTMAACDDYDDIVLWGNRHLDFLRRLQPYHFSIPCADWLRVVMNRIGPVRFLLSCLRCRASARSSRPDRHRWQDLTPQPRSRAWTGGAAPGLGLCDNPQPRAGATGGGRQVQRDHRHSLAAAGTGRVRSAGG